jgi:hypothetical protein
MKRNDDGPSTDHAPETEEDTASGGPADPPDETDPPD